MADKIISRSGFKRSRNVGRYLGAMMQQGRVTRSLYESLVEKVRVKLGIWQKQCLSQAGRITLAQSVIGAIPLFQMQSCKIPKAICTEIEKIQRSFIWGEKDGERKLHSINWEKFLLTKDCGGMGIKCLELQNDALIAKKAWEFQVEPKQMWAKILQAKYAGSRRGGAFVARNGDSSIWTNMCRMWKEMEGRLVWEPGNGKDINFWLDNWLGIGGSLRDVAVNWDPRIDLEKMVADMVNANEEWNFDLLKVYLPSTIIDILHNTLAPINSDGPDMRRWNLMGSDTVSVRAIYKCLSEQRGLGGMEASVWKAVWSWHGPQKAKLLVWKLLHRGLPLMSRIGLWNGGNDTCPICSNGRESFLHAFRDCREAKSLWNLLLVGENNPEFFNQDLDTWMTFNLCYNPRSGSTSFWVTTFILTCWKLWAWRNETMHGSPLSPLNSRETVIRRMVHEVVAAFNPDNGRMTARRKVQAEVIWLPPAHGFIKINTDGAARGNPGPAACGGVIRGSDGCWIGGFGHRLGVCNSFRAELWGILRGLEWAWNAGHRSVVIESDASSIITVLTNSGNAAREGHLVSRIRAWLQRNWCVRFHHIYREGNACADWMANFILNSDENLSHYFTTTPPPGVLLLYLADLTAVSRPRVVMVH